MNPLFIFSLPRSGSTLLQKILGGSQEVTTASEPWFLLPFFYSLKSKGIYTEYGQHILVKALDDFCNILPSGRHDYLLSVGDFAQALYEKSTSGSYKYFLDKTPRYHLIVDDILDAMPNSKSILLWRNPLSIISSIIETFGNGKWVLYAYYVDLFDGLSNLIRTYVKNKERFIVVKYEDLIRRPEHICIDLCKNIDISYHSSMIHDFNKTSLRGRYGDPTGGKLYNAITSATEDKWKITLGTSQRKAWSRRYLEWLGEERLSIMGYNYKDLINELENIPLRSEYIISDYSRRIFGAYYRLVTTSVGNNMQTILRRNDKSNDLR